MKLEGAFKRGTFTVYGATAEILSVLETSSTWRTASNNVIAMEKLVAALDTTTPAEERVEPSVAIIKQLKLQRRLARWIPWYHDLPTHEFAGEFHHTYRDHTIHSLQTFLLGLYLFETVGPLREALERRLGAVTPTSAETLETFVEWWAITALWHDMAYPFEASHFITDVGLQQKILSNLARLLNERAYIEALGSDNSFTSKQRRDAYRLGSHVAFEFESIGDLLSNRGDRIITDLWRRLGANTTIASIAQEIERATTTSSASRPPYHDHGLMGGLVLGFLYDEAERFLTKLVETPKAERDVLPESVWVRAEAGWGDFVENGKLTELAIEAIAFHNINWREFNRSAIKSMWPEEGPFPTVRLESEAHLFFIAIVDTLQDWDRHHFSPQSQASKYRPSVASKNMLLQGVGGKLRVDIRNLPDSVTRVKNLFTDWLNASDVSSLFEGGARVLPRRERCGRGLRHREQRRGITQGARAFSRADRDAYERVQEAAHRWGVERNCEDVPRVHVDPSAGG
ncbi:hypothetical protein [Sorangium sp. So ce406]|uniref:hypothetical protein n=1 Tax=Sorangium sp. So ce406 TaxID=3133311 RepID=UPI003F5B346F